MKKILFTLLCTLLAAAPALAQSGLSCEDAIPVKDGFTATATAGQNTWYTAWTYDLPLTVTFTPEQGIGEQPEITADFTCTKGYYENSKLQQYFGQGSSVQMPMPLKCETKTVGDKTVYILSMEKRLRDLMSSQLGITENIQVYVHAKFPVAGSMEITPDFEYAECMELGNWVNLKEEFPIKAHDDVKTYNLPVGKWSNDSIRMIWHGTGTNTIYLGLNHCQFTHDASDEDFYKQYTFHAGDDTINIPHSEITTMLKNGMQTGGVYYMHTDATSDGTMLFEHLPEPPASGNAKILQMDETVSADSSILYCFSTKWNKSMLFESAAVNKFRMVVSKKPFEKDQIFDNTDIIDTYQFDKVETGHILKLNAAQLQSLNSNAATGEKYLYVRFYCIDPKAKVTPSLWSTSECEEKAPILESGETIQLNSANRTKNYRFNANEWCNGDIEIYWKSSSQIQIFVFDSCGQTSTSKQNPHYIWSATKPAAKNGATYKLASQDEMKSWQWIDKAIDNGNLYMMLYSDKGDVKVTLQREEEKEVEIPEDKQDSTFITIKNAAETHLMTGLAAGYTAEAKFEGSTLRDVNLSSCFGTDGMPMFDELYVFTTTTTTQTQTTPMGLTITAATNKAGSNAKTPCYIYHRDEEGYRLMSVVENVNTSEPIVRYISLNSAGLEQKSVYITGFAPYASTGWTASDEGVFYLRGGEGDKMDVYLEDAYIYSRNKTISGAISTASSGNNTYTSDHACASGAVLVFECMDKQNAGNPFQATIHIKGCNQLMSVNGHFFAHVAGNVNHPCAPVEIHLTDKDAAENVPSYTELNLTDEWNGVRTHGFLSLQKSANNAPSIDLGNKYTVLNMRGGQVELQNAQVMSNNYKNTMAISYRDGKVGNVFMSYGIGSDNAGGTLNFWDGTTSVIPMKVQEEYRQYYLMDADGETTSCLRCPANTHVYGGSQCWLRACQNVESKGGAPMGYNDVPVGQIVYTAETLSTFNSKSPCIGGTYGIESIDTDSKGNYYFWIPASCDPSIRPEQDQQTQFWLAAMTSIEAEFGGFGGKVGGDVTVGDKQVSNLLYCAIDDNISTIITETDENDQYIYQAPVKNPTGSDYVRISPSYVGDELSNNVLDDEDYTIQNHIYYICPTSADEWRLFAAPFDVKRLWVVETYDEKRLRAMEADEENYLTQREVVMYEQARHNADFAGFFGVVLALGSNTPFDKIFEDYISWAKQEDKAAGRWDGKSEYTLRGRKELTAGKDFYLSEVKTSDTWTMQEGDTTMSTPWQTSTGGEMLMRKGQIYRMLFPYKYGNGNDNHNDNENDNDNEEWDYWSGKLLIFEGDGPQTLYGRKSLRELQQGISVTERNGHVSGNFSLSNMESITHLPKDVYQFIPEGMDGQFYLLDDTSIDEYNPLHPSEAFLVASIPTTETLGEPTNVHVESGLISYYKEEEEIGTGIFSPALKEEGVVRKIMHNGELYIIRGGEIYNIIGRQLR